MGRCVVVIVIEMVLVVELTDGVVDGFDGFGEVVSGHLVPSSSYQHINSGEGVVTSGLGHQVTAVVVGDWKQPGLSSPTSSR